MLSDMLVAYSLKPPSALEVFGVYRTPNAQSLPPLSIYNAKCAWLLGRLPPASTILLGACAIIVCSADRLLKLMHYYLVDDKYDLVQMVRHPSSVLCSSLKALQRHAVACGACLF